MTQIHNLEEAEALLATYIPAVREVTGKDMTLTRMAPMMQLLDHPEAKVKLVHVAGTSGKTSTCYYIASLLMATGKQVGLTVSPHLDSVTERIQINLQPIAEPDFCQNLGEFLDIIKDVDPRPTYFELLVAFAYWYFAKMKVDYAVIETGLGGSFDATNVAKASNKVCVITDIGFDHMHILGHTIPEIARQKAGIIHYGNQAFMFSQGEEVDTVFQTQATKNGAVLHYLHQNGEQQNLTSAHLTELPLFQQRNWLLAHAIYMFLKQRDDIQSLDGEQLADTMDVQVPGRMDSVKVEDKELVMDGAHNEQKMTAFVTSFQKLYPGTRVPILLSLKESKDYASVLPLLLPITEKLLLTTFTARQDLPFQPADPSVLADAARRAGIANVVAEPDQATALKLLLAEPHKVLVITGSFFLLSDVRQRLAQL